MHRIFVSLTAMAVGIAALSSTAHAQFNTPFKGKQFKGNLMTAYLPCTTPDTTTDDAIPACTTPVRSTPSCGWGGGQGKIQLKMQTVGNVDTRIKLTSLDAACEGLTLTVQAMVRRTGHWCSGNVCQTVDTPAALGTCAVQHQTCKINGQLNLPGGPNIGQTEILDLAILNGTSRVFDVGLVKSQ